MTTNRMHISLLTLPPATTPECYRELRIYLNFVPCSWQRAQGFTHITSSDTLHSGTLMRTIPPPPRRCRCNGRYERLSSNHCSTPALTCSAQSEWPLPAKIASNLAGSQGKRPYNHLLHFKSIPTDVGHGIVWWRACFDVLSNRPVP